MHTISDDISDPTAGWVRLVGPGDARWVGRWPGPHPPGETIRTAGAARGGWRFDHVDGDAQGGPEAVYIWDAS
jgi:hypothetical protein